VVNGITSGLAAATAVQNASRPEERCVATTLGSLAED
jgi:NaMN:DMB phosphoribosyltransferase